MNLKIPTNLSSRIAPSIIISINPIQVGDTIEYPCVLIVVNDWQIILNSILIEHRRTRIFAPSAFNFNWFNSIRVYKNMETMYSDDYFNMPYKMIINSDTTPVLVYS